MTPVLPDRLCWSSAIGNFIINFNTLDYLVFEFLELFLPDQLPKAKDERFQERIRRIKAHVDRSAYPTELKKRFTEFFDRLEPVRDLRNHIAHGHFLLHQAGDTKNIVMTLSLPRDLVAAHSPNPRHLDYAELEKIPGPSQRTDRRIQPPDKPRRQLVNESQTITLRALCAGNESP